MRTLLSVIAMTLTMVCTYAQTIRYQNSIRGGLTVATNSLELTGSGSTPTYCNTDGGTTMSSYSDLILPAGSTIVKAYLYLEYYSYSTAITPITSLKFKVPGGSYQTLNTSSAGFIANPTNSNQYAQFIIDVTNLMPANGYVSTTTAGGNAATTGRYSVADPGGMLTANNGCGWCLMVVYSNPISRLRNVTIVDKCASFTSSATNTTFNVPNIAVPSAGTINAIVIVTGTYGDESSIIGPLTDYVKFGKQGTTLTQLNDPVSSPVQNNNALNSTIGMCANNNVTIDGVSIPAGNYVARNPYNTFSGIGTYQSSYEYDCDVFDASSALTVSPTPITVTFTQATTSTDALGSGAYGISIDIAPAKLTKSISPSTICDGETATYTFTVSNTELGSINQSNIGFTDNIPSGLKIASPNGVTITGGTGGTVTAVPGSNTFTLSGLNLNGGQTATITLNVTNVAEQYNPSCSSNPAAFTNGPTNIVNNTANLANGVTPQCLIVNQKVTPTFGAVGSYCSGASIPALPTTSTNGITGTWSPAINNTATTTYTFTPNTGVCALPVTLTITINPNVTPTFNPVGSFCSGASIPALPTTSTNGITGTWSPAINNTVTTTYTFTPTTGLCATTTTLTITITSPTLPTFATVGPYCSGASIPALPTTSTNGITGTWSPAINNTATTTYTFTPTAGQCASATTLTITVNSPVTPTFGAVGPYCSGASIPALPTTSTNGITGTWSPSINNTATTTYTFTPAANECASTTTLTVTINPNVTPTFGAVGPYCSGASIPALPTTSTNGITGTWSPAINNTVTTTYTFTPTAGLCATTTTLSVTITPNVTPTFTIVGPYCSGASIPALPTTSNNGITGTWSPAINNTATTTYTFTPTAGLCATTTTMTVSIDQPVTPTFNPVGPFCTGGSVPALPTTSVNGITGTWSPAINNTATTTYTFTPNAGQCATATTLTITIDQPVTPAFTAIPPYCVNDVPATLPVTSNNGITGTWSPSTINTSTAGSTNYTFTPNSSECASPITITVVVGPPSAPTFNGVGPFCSGDAIPPLPTTSVNGVPGSWSPVINNTATTTYTFTPNAGACATTAALTITINSPVVPTFGAVGPYCSGASIPALPTTSTNGIIGTWSPAINNTTTTTYTFTPDANQCAAATTLTITIDQPVVPTFGAVGPYCSGGVVSALPTTSTNGITGTWSPAINNMATTTYSFTPTSGQCASPTTLTIVIDQPVTPTFTTIPPYCVNDVPATLQTTSTNGITGTWSPSVISTSSTGSTNYTFTPDASQCASPVTITVVVGPPATPTFGAVGPYCSGASIPALPSTSTNGINGVWSPAINNTATTTYTFTPNSGQCATTTTLTITIDQPVTPVFGAVGPYCSGASIPALPSTSTNGINGTWSPGINNTSTTTYTFTPAANQCATTTTLTITIDQPVTPTFTAMGPYCQGTVAGTLSGSSLEGISGAWSPSTISTATVGTTTYTFTPNGGQCATTATLSVTITAPNTTPTFTNPGPLCSGTSFTLSGTSNEGVNGIWSPAVNNTATTTYTFVPNGGQCATSSTMTVSIVSPVTPAFNTIPPYCVNDVPATLQSTSNNGITGIWSPSTINTSATGSTNYTFTPNSGQCAVPVTITITVGPPATPTFTSVPAFCENTTAPVLPSSSLNGFNGSWTPASVDNQNSGTYTFTPNNGQCATTTSMTITVTPRVNSNFTQYPAYCANSTIPALPATSTNGIDGSWTPALNNTTTTNYTFTPNASECANPATMVITINAPVTPTFAPLNAVCRNANVPALLTTSTNGISGTWSPAAFSTTTAGTFTATFTPNPGQCATTTTLSLTVNELPMVSANSPTTCTNVPVQLTANGAMNYTWTPGTGLSSTTGSQVTATVSSNQTYTIIGTDANGCSSSSQATITIAPGLSISVLPPDATICLGESVTLTANGAANYTWSPGATLNTTSGSTVNATPNSTTTYTVTGSDANGCTGVKNVIVTVNNPVVPIFNSSGPYCAGSAITALPTTSNNGISGSWSPAINNAATTAYTFTPGSGQCASTGTQTIVINQPVPTLFVPLNPICQGADAPALPTTDLSGISGVWTPSTVDNQSDALYTFTPNPGECALQGSVTSTILPNPVASFNMSNATPDVTFTDVEFFNTSTNADAYSWDFGDGVSSTQENPAHSYPGQIGTYTIVLTATNAAGCTDETMRIIEVKEDLFIYVPNTFTPDGDANNNTFFPVISGDFDPQNFTMLIFNRWGEVVYETHDVNVGWDGTYHGMLAQEGVYSWKIDLKAKNNDNKKVFSGHITIMK